MTSSALSQNDQNLPILTVTHLKKSYGAGTSRIEVLRDVTFDVLPNEWVAIMGASGSGKTTLLNLIGLLDSPDDGLTIYEGNDIQTLKSNQKALFRSSKIGIVLQHHYLVPTMTVKENIEMPFIWSREKISLAEMEERTLAAIELVGLTERINHFPDELSGGELQRTSIARAIVNKPPLMLLDEPTGNLDVKTGKAILNIFRKISNTKTSLIMVTHDPEAAQLADRILLLKKGELIKLK